MRWTDKDTEYLKARLSDKTVFMSEIAFDLGKKSNQVRYHARKLGWSGKQNYRKSEWNIKYNLDLVKQVMDYFLLHSKNETMKHFELSSKSFKSIMERGYKRKEFSHMRKDNRRKDPWSFDEELFVIRHAGVVPSDWIAKKLSRATGRNIKERLKNKMNAKSEWLNGMPYSLAKETWPNDKSLLKLSIKTEAGPTHFKFRVIQWHDAFALAKKHNADETTLACLDSLRKFAEFIHGTKSKGAIKRRFGKAISEIKGRKDVKGD